MQAFQHSVRERAAHGKSYMPHAAGVPRKNIWENTLRGKWATFSRNFFSFYLKAWYTYQGDSDMALWKTFLEKKLNQGDFPGSPVVTTPCCQCWGHRFDPGSGNQDPTCHVVQPKGKKTWNWQLPCIHFLTGDTTFAKWYFCKYMKNNIYQHLRFSKWPAHDIQYRIWNRVLKVHRLGFKIYIPTNL